MLPQLGWTAFNTGRFGSCFSVVNIGHCVIYIQYTGHFWMLLYSRLEATGRGYVLSKAELYLISTKIAVVFSMQRVPGSIPIAAASVQITRITD
jgi:hypothetical protein